MLARPLQLLSVLAVLAVAAWLRTTDLARRPMHSDEANQAVKAGELLESGRYAFDPRDHHGPTLYYAALPIAWLRGQTTLAALDETTVRLVPAVAGTLAVLLLIGAAWPLGPGPALTAGALLAVAPPAVYFSRYFIQETLLSAFTLAAYVCGARWWRTGRLAWLLVSGAAAGLMLATKASAPVFLIALLGGAWAARPGRPASAHLSRDAGLAVMTCLAVAALFYTSFGTHAAGIRDAVSAFGVGGSRAAAGSGHEKPWWYYFSLFGVLRHGGLVWNQLGFAALAACGSALTVALLVHRSAPSSASAHPARRTMHTLRTNTWNDRTGGLLVGTLVYTVVVAAALSAIPYKTPWHVIHFVPGFAMLGAGAVALFPRARIGVLMAALVLIMQWGQTRLAVFQRPADARNPYAYVHASPDMLKIRGVVEQALQRDPGQPVRVIGEEYWPIPWYLRGLERVGYWSVAPEPCDGALVIASGSQIDVVRQRLGSSYRESYYGLRPEVLCVVFTPTK